MSSTEKPWGALDPNSQHQLWSQWTFTVYEGGKHVPYAEVVSNGARYMRQGFGSVAQMRVEEKFLRQGAIIQRYYVLTVRVEGVPAHDSGYVASVRLQFERHFAKRGWGPLATSSVHVKVLAGDTQDGKPPAQLVVMPSIIEQVPRA